MNRRVQGGVLLLLGLAVLRVSLTDLLLRYVQPWTRPPLLVTALLLMAAGAGSLVLGGRGHAHEQEGDHGHEHGGGVGWLLLVPAVVLALAAPQALGSFTASRTESSVAAPTAPLEAVASPSDGVVDLGVEDLYQRAVYAPDSLAGTTVRVTGFVSGTPAAWSVTVLLVSCCAADARPVKVQVDGMDAPPVNSWVVVTGTLGATEGRVAHLTATSVTPRAAPRSPYTYSYA